MYEFPADTHSGLIIFSDLDGTLLDHDSYSWEAARPALERLRDLKVALILSTSKTLAELEVLACELHNFYPCIVENGAGIAWPRIDPSGSYVLETLGQERHQLLQLLVALRSKYQFRACAEMDTREFSELTGLSLDGALRAMDRKFSEPLIWRDDLSRIADFRKEVEAQGLNLLQGGRFLHLMGAADKGLAMERVLQTWASEAGGYQTVALGDSQNDIAMLRRADIAVVVRSQYQSPPDFPARDVRLVTDLIGPAGWNSAVLGVLDSMKTN